MPTNKRTADFDIIFHSLNDSVKDIFGHEMNPNKPNTLISDVAGSIHNGFINIFGENDILICWPRLRRNDAQNLPKYLIDDKTRLSFLSELDTLQLAKNKTIFNVGSVLFMDKWRQRSQNPSNMFRLRML